MCWICVLCQQHLLQIPSPFCGLCFCIHLMMPCDNKLFLILIHYSILGFFLCSWCFLCLFRKFLPTPRSQSYYTIFSSKDLFICIYLLYLSLSDYNTFLIISEYGSGLSFVPYQYPFNSTARAEMLIFLHCAACHLRYKSMFICVEIVHF